MKNVILLVVGVAVGVAVGFVVAHEVAKTSGGKRFFEEVDAKAHAFGSAVADGYRAREAELRAAIDEAEDAIADLRER